MLRSNQKQRIETATQSQSTNITVSHLSNSYHFRNPDELGRGGYWVYGLLHMQPSRHNMALFPSWIYCLCDKRADHPFLSSHSSKISSPLRLIPETFYINTTTFQIKVYHSTVPLWLYLLFHELYTAQCKKRKSTS